MNIQEVHNVVSVTWRVHLIISHYVCFVHVQRFDMFQSITLENRIPVYFNLYLHHNIFEGRASSIMCAAEEKGLYFSTLLYIPMNIVNS